MADDISKLCSDFLRETYPGLKASHGRELVAAFFGYRTHASLLAETRYDVHSLGDAEVLIPNIPLIDERRACLNALPESLPESRFLAEELADYLQEHEFFTGEVWLLDEDLATYVREDYLPNNVDSDLDNYLADVIANTNAFFEEAYYEDAKIEDGVESVRVTVNGQYNGENDDDHLFAGDTIDMVVVVELARVAARSAFAKPEVDVNGNVRDFSEHEDEDAEAVTARLTKNNQQGDYSSQPKQSGIKTGNTKEDSNNMLSKESMPEPHLKEEKTPLQKFKEMMEAEDTANRATEALALTKEKARDSEFETLKQFLREFAKNHQTETGTTEIVFHETVPEKPGTSQFRVRGAICNLSKGTGVKSVPVIRIDNGAAHNRLIEPKMKSGSFGEWDGYGTTADLAEKILLGTYNQKLFLNR